MVYMVEMDCDEFISSWTFARVCAALAFNYEDIFVMCMIYKFMYGLNVGVLVVCDMLDFNIKYCEVVLVRECAYYDEVETLRIMVSSLFGLFVFLCIEYVNGMYYIF